MKKILLILAAIILAVATISGCSQAAKNAESEETNNEISKVTESSYKLQSETTKSTTPTKAPVKTLDLIEPVQLISLDEASSLIGEAAREGDKTEQAATGLKALMYEAVDENSFEFLQISITQQSFMPDNEQTPQTIYDSIVAAFDGGEKIDGIGDTAVFATPGIHIMSDGYYITFGAGNLNDDAVRATLKQAGALAVKNLREILD